MTSAASARTASNEETSDLGAAAQEAARLLSARLEAADFTGWDPYDALSSPVLRSLRPRLVRQLALQGVKRFPVNIRPVLAIRPQRHTKALALLTSAFSKLSNMDPGRAYGRRAVELAHDVEARAIRTSAGAGWGYDFDVQTRWGYYAKGEPNAVVTAFAAHALLDASSVGGDASRLVDAAIDFAAEELFVESGNRRFFAYVRGSTTPIHNANLLLASIFGRRGRELERARDAIQESVAAQRPDGSWPYGEGPRLDWVDGFHTAYVLERLGQWRATTGDGSVDDALRRGLDFYLARLIDTDGAARATTASRFPLDIHACASAITALTGLRNFDSRAVPAAAKVLRWTLANMRRSDGRFMFQRHRFWRNATPFIRWNDAHMLLALASYTSEAE